METTAVNTDNPYPSATASVTPTSTTTATTTTTTTTGDLSGDALQSWEEHGRTSNVQILDFNQDFSIRHIQQYTLWHANWEVYVGRFDNANQDGVFLYDRLEGEGRLMDFGTNLLLNNYQEMHNLQGNWVIYSGDFAGSGQAQLLFYDPTSGDGQVMAFKHDLSLASQKTLSNLGTNMSVYVGHFGSSTLSVMLYDPQNAQSTFIAFDSSFNIAHQYLVNTWDQNKQVLVGDFLDRTRCAAGSNCPAGDDILVLDRRTGKLQQYVFSFGRKFSVYDNRIQSFARQGINTEESVSSVDTTTFSLMSTESTSIRNEELY